MLGPPSASVAVHRLPATVSRRIDHRSDFPAGLVLAGDAWHTHDPLAGSGLTAAADAATALADLAGHTPIDRLGQAWLERIA